MTNSINSLAGDREFVYAGAGGVASVGVGGVAMAGPGGLIQIKYVTSGGSYELKIGRIGPDALKPHVPYRLSPYGEFEVAL